VTPMADKTLRKAKSPEAAYYHAAWRACRKLAPGEESDLDLVAKLDDLLKSGWSIQALKAYAFSVWQKSDRDDAAEAAWRLAVEFADSNGCSGGRGFLKRFNANRERYSCEAMRREQQASPSTSS
jgi:hypothetical protein